MFSSSFAASCRTLPLVFTVLVLAGPRLCGQDVPALLKTLVANEDAASQRRPPYMYLSEERSDRTGGHLWKEKVAETSYGKVKFLIAEDGHPLSPARAAAEHARLAEIAAHPDAFRKREQAMRNDEMHAKDMLALLPKAFLFDAPQQDGEYLKIPFHPNPNYAPQSMEERVLHGMHGTLEIEPRLVRLRAIEGKMPDDVAIGFGLIATIRAGSSFSTIREHLDAAEWKTQFLNTNIQGRAIFFKTIAKQEQSQHGDFKRLPTDISVANAVALLEQ